MPRTVIQIYAAAVCFVAVATFALAIGIATYSAVGVVNPGFMVHPMAVMPPDLPMTFGPFPLDGSRPNVTSEAMTPPKRSPEEDAKRRAEAMAMATQSQRATSSQALLRWVIAAFVSGLLFIAHWLILRKENQRVA
jgi:hypothetical protein